MIGRICKTTAVPSYGVALQNGHPECPGWISGHYGHVLVHKLLLSGFEVVSVIFEKGRYHFALFALSAKCRF